MSLVLPASTPAKRRLIHVADDNEALLEEITYTPPTRSTTFSKAQVRLSSDDDGRSAHSPRVSSVSADASSMLVSYNGFLLLDGSGHYQEPRSTAHAAELQEELNDCLHFLKRFLPASGCSSSAPSESCSQSDTSDQSWDSTDDSEEEENLSVAQLRQRLHELGLPTSGTKAALVSRLQQKRREKRSPAPSRQRCDRAKETSGTTFEAPLLQNCPSVSLPEATRDSRQSTTSRASTALLSNRSSHHLDWQAADGVGSVRHSSAKASSERSSGSFSRACETAEQQLLTPVRFGSIREGSEELPSSPAPAPTPSRSIWGTLVHAGSRLLKSVASTTPSRPSTRKRLRESF